MNIGDKVRDLRMEMGLSQGELADQLKENGVKISRSYLSQIEREGRIPSGEFLVVFAKMTNVTSDYLLGLAEDEPQAETAGDILTPEAATIAAMVDTMAKPMRQTLVAIAQDVKLADEAMQELRNAHDAMAVQLVQLVQGEGSAHMKARARQIVESSLLGGLGSVEETEQLT